jgi:hypothetical protein
LFLGIVRSCAKEVIFDWLTAHREWSDFLKVIQPVISSIARLRLEWIKVYPISKTGSYGGYISESYLALGRLFPYICHITQDLVATDVPYQDPPGKTIDDFKVPQMWAWLRARRIKPMKNVSGKINKPELRAAIEATGWRKPGDDPPIPEPISKGKDHASFVRMLVSTYNVVSSIMSVSCIPDEATLASIDRHIKLYLSYDHSYNTVQQGSGLTEHVEVHIASAGTNPNAEVDVLVECEGSDSDSVSSVDSVDESMDIVDRTTPKVPLPHSICVLKKNQRIPSLIARNKINLLKYPETMRHFGPMRLLTELGWAGEANIQTVKPIIKRIQGLKQNWQTNCARHWLHRKFCRIYLSLCSQPDVVDDGRDSFVEAIHRMYGRFIPQSNESNDQVIVNSGKQFHVYKGLQEINYHLENGEAISCLEINANLVVTIDDNEAVVCTLPITRHCNPLGLDGVYTLSVGTVTEQLPVPNHLLHKANTVLLVPLGKKGCNQRLYIMVTRDWKPLPFYS